MNRVRLTRLIYTYVCVSPIALTGSYHLLGAVNGVQIFLLLDMGAAVVTVNWYSHHFGTLRSGSQLRVGCDCRSLQSPGSGQDQNDPYHPQSDGLVERFNRTLLDMLATAAREQPFDWESQLWRLCLAYNTSTHQTTGEPPFS